MTPVTRARAATIRVLVRILLLAALATTAAYLLSAIQGLRPWVTPECSETRDPILDPHQAFDTRTCTEERREAFVKSSYRSAPILVRIDERDGVVRTTLGMNLPKDDSLVAAFRSGVLTDGPRELAHKVFGAYMGGSSITWQQETVKVDQGSAIANIEVSNTERSSSARRRGIFFERRANVEVDLTDTRLGHVSGLDDVIQQSLTSLRGVATERTALVIEFAPPGVAIPDDSWPSVFATLWRDAQNYLWPRLLAAVPWLLLVFCVIRCNLVWRRYRWFLAVLLAAHAGLVGAVVIQAIDYVRLDPSYVAFAANRWGIAVYPVMPGSVVLLATSLAFLGAYAVRHRPGGLRPPTLPAQARYASGWTLVGVVLWIACGVAYVWMGQYHVTSILARIALIGGITLLLVLAALTAWVVRRRHIKAFVGLVGLATPLTVIAGLADLTGAIPAALRFGLPWLVAIVALTSLAALTAAAIGAEVSKAGWVLIIVTSAALGYPTSQGSTGPLGITWYVLSSFALRLDSLLAAVLLLALGFALYHAREYETSDKLSPRVVRWRGVGCAFVVLAGAYSFDSRPSLLLLIAAGAFAWWLFPASQVTVARRLAGLSDQDRRKALVGLIKAGEARRVLAALRKGMRDKVASGDLALSEASTKILSVERAAAIQDDVVDGIPLRDRALGTLGGRSAWERARWGAITGTIVGLPWTAFALYGVATTSPEGETYPVLAALALIAPQLVKWTAYGMLFGYFFPLLRGSTGLTKSLCLFVAAAVPSAVDIIPSGVGIGGWQAILLVVMQTVSFAMTLGLLSDRLVLRVYRHDGARLADVHKLGAVAAWASSVAVSAGTALATVLIVGLQPFIAGTVQPPSPPSPPPAVTAPR